MINRISAIAVGAIALSTVLGSTAVQAQESCPAMYGRMMSIYQANPYSPAYAQMLPYYNSRCLTGATYQPAPTQDPYPGAAYSQYQQPVPDSYGYGPAPVDPAAAVLGAAIVGGAIAADGGYRSRDGWRDRGDWRR